MLCLSIKKYIKKTIIFHVIFNENDEHYESFLQWYRYFCKKDLLGHNVKLYKKTDFWPPEAENHLRPLQLDGWVDQQVIKLLISKRITTPEYVVFDSKNFFIRDCTLDDIRQVHPANIGWTHEHLENWVKTCCKHYDLHYPGRQMKLTQNITPYIIGTKYAQDLVNEFGSDEKFHFWFTDLSRHDKLNPAEFFLYEIYTMKKGVRNRGTTGQNTFSIWSFMHDDYEWKIPDYIKALQHEITTRDIKVSALHKRMREIFTIDDVIEIYKSIGAEDIIPLINHPFLKN